MPRHQNADLARRLQRRYSFDPPFAPDTIAPEIVPVTLVDQLVENVADEKRAICGIAQSNHATEKSYAQISNPAGSGIIVVVEEIWLVFGSGDTWELGYYDSVLSSSNYPEYWLDRRSSGSPAALVRRQNGTPTFQAIVKQGAFANYNEFIPLNWILGEGDNMGVATGSANIYLRATFIWREIQKNPLED